MCTDSHKEDLSYTNISLNTSATEVSAGTHKILRMEWNPKQDIFVFNITELARHMATLEPTKRTVVGVNAHFFDPLVVMCLITVKFKVFFKPFVRRRLVVGTITFQDDF